MPLLPVTTYFIPTDYYYCWLWLLLLSKFIMLLILPWHLAYLLLGWVCSYYQLLHVICNITSVLLHILVWHKSEIILLLLVYYSYLLLQLLLHLPISWFLFKLQHHYFLSLRDTTLLRDVAMSTSTTAYHYDSLVLLPSLHIYFLFPTPDIANEMIIELIVMTLQKHERSRHKYVIKGVKLS